MSFYIVQRKLRKVCFKRGPYKTEAAARAAAAVLPASGLTVEKVQRRKNPRRKNPATYVVMYNSDVIGEFGSLAEAKLRADQYEGQGTGEPWIIRRSGSHTVIVEKGEKENPVAGDRKSIYPNQDFEIGFDEVQALNIYRGARGALEDDEDDEPQKRWNPERCSARNATSPSQPSTRVANESLVPSRPSPQTRPLGASTAL